MQSVTELKPVMTLEQLELTNVWNICTPKQRLWLRSFIESHGDADFSTKSAYQSGSERYFSMLSHQLRKNQNIRAVLAVFYGEALNYPDTDVNDALRNERERKSFFRTLQKRILKGELTIADVEATRMVCREFAWALPTNLPPGHNGYVPKSQRPAESEPETKPRKVGEVIHQNDGDYEVLAVDSNGHVTSVKNLLTGEIENEF